MCRLLLLTVQCVSFTGPSSRAIWSFSWWAPVGHAHWVCDHANSAFFYHYCLIWQAQRSPYCYVSCLIRCMVRLTTAPHGKHRQPNRWAHDSDRQCIFFVFFLHKILRWYSQCHPILREYSIWGRMKLWWLNVEAIGKLWARFNESVTVMAMLLQLQRKTIKKLGTMQRTVFGRWVYLLTARFG